MLNRIGASVICLSIAVFPAFLTGCSTLAPQQATVIEEVGDIDMSRHRIRVAATNALYGYMSSVELTADSIIGATSDPGVKYNALVWKANAIPAYQQAMFHPDPLISFADGWAMTVQMREYFEVGNGRELFGPQQRFAVSSSRQMETATDEAVRANLEPEEHDRLRRFVYDWAARHPLDNPLFLRRSVTEAAAEELGAERLGGAGAVGSMAEMAQDFQQMALVYAGQIPKQVRWQSELLIASLADSLRFHSFLAAIDDMEVMVETTRFLREAPSILTAEREAVFREIQEERIQMLREIDRQRMVTLQEILAWARLEREAMLEEMAS
ncbi:MAG: hypothetical protein ACWGSQ_12495, partial [Longimicrobiales bacterium]